MRLVQAAMEPTKEGRMIGLECSPGFAEKFDSGTGRHVLSWDNFLLLGGILREMLVRMVRVRRCTLHAQTGPTADAPARFQHDRMIKSRGFS
jgi:hypothetical protein